MKKEKKFFGFLYRYPNEPFDDNHILDVEAENEEKAIKKAKRFCEKHSMILGKALGKCKNI